MPRKNRVLAIVLACMLAFSFVSCTLWMSINSAHECTDKCCMVCALIGSLENALRKVLTVEHSSVQADVVLHFAVLCVPLYLFALSKETLVALKVKLTD